MKISELSQIHYANRSYTENFDGLIYFPIEKKGTLAIGVTDNIEIALTFVKGIKNLLFKSRLEVKELLKEYDTQKCEEVYKYIKENGIKSINLKNSSGLVKLNKSTNELTISRDLINNALHRISYLYDNKITEIPIFIKHNNRIELYSIQSIDKTYSSFIVRLKLIPRSIENGKNS